MDHLSVGVIAYGWLVRFFAGISGKSANLAHIVMNFSSSLSHSFFVYVYILLGISLVDYDLVFCSIEGNHRDFSPFHCIENALLALLVAMLFHWGLHYGSEPAAGVWVSVADFMFGVCWGWVFHLVGDMLQGGVRSRLLGRRIGLTGFTWNTYMLNRIWLTPVLLAGATYTIWVTIPILGFHYSDQILVTFLIVLSILLGNTRFSLPNLTFGIISNILCLGLVSYVLIKLFTFR